MVSTIPDAVRRAARAPDLAVLIDLDGTLIPFATPPLAARLDVGAAQLVRSLTRCPRTQIVIVSGRPKPELDALFPDTDGPWLVAEHGGWRRRLGSWTGLDLGEATPHGAEERLREVCAAHPGATIERKTWSVALHYRNVPDSDREGTYVDALLALDGWLRTWKEYELLEGRLVIEVRHRSANKGTTLPWLRSAVPPGTSVIAIGDDLSDEDTFAALGIDDVAIAVGPDERPTRAPARLAGVEACRSFLSWLVGVRSNDAVGDPVAMSGLHPAATHVEAPLLVVSNRLPPDDDGSAARDRPVGGLASGVSASLRSRRGMWLGWSGRTHEGAKALAVDETTGRAGFDLTPQEHALYYNGFANRSLWPVLHGFVERARFRDAEWTTYVEVNERFADHAMELTPREGVVWAHDFHLLLLARALRDRGHTGRKGLFLHVPFPSIDAFETVPHAEQLLVGMLAFDLVGFHTERHAANFARTAAGLLGATETTRGLVYAGRITRVGVFPLGIDADEFGVRPEDELDPEMVELRAAIGDLKLVLGVDRLDYTKGIPERIDTFARMFELVPEWRGKASLLQIAVPSRADVPEYKAQRQAIENAVGRVNGEMGEAHWVPVRYVSRSYDRSSLAQLYRAARVGLVTPLRDGMNLVAKEYVAAQDPDDPGVLVLSRLAGAAAELGEALLTNPYDRGATARTIARALGMPREERIARHRALLAAVQRSSPASWCEAFLEALTSGRWAP